MESVFRTLHMFPLVFLIFREVILFPQLTVEAPRDQINGPWIGILTLEQSFSNNYYNKCPGGIHTIMLIKCLWFVPVKFCNQWQFNFYPTWIILSFNCYYNIVKCYTGYIDHCFQICMNTMSTVIFSLNSATKNG